MIPTNIDLLDRLINCQISTVKYISINQNEVNAIYVAFVDVSTGQIRINGNDLIANHLTIRGFLSKGKRHQYTLISTKSPAINNTQFPHMLS